VHPTQERCEQNTRHSTSRKSGQTKNRETKRKLETAKSKTLGTFLRNFPLMRTLLRLHMKNAPMSSQQRKTAQTDMSSTNVRTFLAIGPSRRAAVEWTRHLSSAKKGSNRPVIAIGFQIYLAALLSNPVWFLDR